MNKRKVIIDTDPGIDDLLAISMALVSEELDILAISTVHGNVSLENTTQNAQLICDILEKDIKIIEGSNKPIFSERKRNSNVHGDDGMGGLRNKYRQETKNRNDIETGINKLYNLIMNSDEKLTIIALGPLTNIAKLLLINDKVKNKIEEIHIMGGGDRIGNVNELAEFNFLSDSYAAKIVMNSKIPIYLSGLDVTKKVYFKDNELELLAEDTYKQRFIKESVLFYANLDPYMHDVCAVLTLTHPEFFKFTECDIDVITSNDITDGMMYLRKDNGQQLTSKLADTDNREEIVKYIFNTLNNNFS